MKGTVSVAAAACQHCVVSYELCIVGCVMLLVRLNFVFYSVFGFVLFCSM